MEFLERAPKKAVRDKRGSGQRRKVMPATRSPSDWKGFLRVDDNKRELLQLLADDTVSLTIPENKEIYSTYGEQVLTMSSTGRTEMTILEPCSHEEADTQLMVHVLDASLCGYQRIMIRTNDTDVVVLAVSIADIIQGWIRFRKTSTEHSCAYHCRNSRTREGVYLTIVPCTKWMRHGFFLRWKMEEDCLGCMERVPSANTSIVNPNLGT